MSTIKCSYRVLKIIFRDFDTGFTISRGKFTQYPQGAHIPTAELVLKGHFLSIQEDDEFTAEGTWNNNSDYGFHLITTCNSMIKPTSENGIERFLIRFVPGVGKGIAQKIVETYREETLKKIRENPANISAIPGIGKQRAKKIHYKITEHDKFEEIELFVLQKGGTHRTALQVYEAFGDSAIRIIRDRPYILSTLEGIGFLTADKFAKELGIIHNAPERVEAGVEYYIEQCMQYQGDLYIHHDDIVEKMPLLFQKKEPSQK